MTEDPNPQRRRLAVSQLGDLWSKHLTMADDAGRRGFVEAARTRPHARWKTWSHRWLRSVLSDYDVNGLLGMYPMYLLSTDEWRALSGERLAGSLLDVGAGDGGLTRHLAPLFREVATTEKSWAMARRLRRSGYSCARVDIGETTLGRSFECVSCLNVLDRTAYPRRLLRALGEHVAPDGALILATPLPLRPFYYSGPRTLTPLERIAAPGPTWERAAVQWVHGVSEVLPAFELVRWTNAPYLSWGDSDQSLYELEDWVGLWRRRRLADPTSLSKSLE